MSAAAVSPAPLMVEVEGLTRSFGAVRALNGIGFTLARGDVLAVFGPNGAGKTTLLRVLAGLLQPDRGRVSIAGSTFDRADPAQRRRIGYISHQSLCYDGLTAAENLEFYARLYALPDPRGTARVALAAVGLEARAGSPVATMSRGMVQRLAIARALLHDPALVLLDEPFTGLDQRAAGALRAQLARVRDGGRTVVMVTHNLDEGLELATHAAIQVAGRFAEFGTRPADVAAFRARYAEVVHGG